jgi:hypothetical protein
MAAPFAAEDFSHLVAATRGVSLSVNNLSIESDPSGALSQLPAIVSKIDPSTDVILEFGDNVHTISRDAFGSAYDQLATAVATGHRLVCLSTFWQNPNVDSAIKASCEAHGGHYVYIGDIFTDAENPDRQSTAYSNWMVNIHPQSWGHARIAERILLQLKPH